MAETNPDLFNPKVEYTEKILLLIHVVCLDPIAGTIKILLNIL